MSTKRNRAFGYSALMGLASAATAGALILVAPVAPAAEHGGKGHKYDKYDKDHKKGPPAKMWEEGAHSGTALADNTSVASGSAKAFDHSVASGNAVAKHGSTASGCSVAIDKSTASGADCPPPKVKKPDVTVITKPPKKFVPEEEVEFVPRARAPRAQRVQARFTG